MAPTARRTATVDANALYRLCELRPLADLPPDLPVRVVTQHRDAATGRWARTVTVQVLSARDADVAHAFVLRSTLRTLTRPDRLMMENCHEPRP